MEALQCVFRVQLRGTFACHDTGRHHRVLRPRHDSPARLWATLLLVQQHCLSSYLRRDSTLRRHVAERSIFLLERLPHLLNKVEDRRAVNLAYRFLSVRQTGSPYGTHVAHGTACWRLKYTRYRVPFILCRKNCFGCKLRFYCAQ